MAISSPVTRNGPTLSVLILDLNPPVTGVQFSDFAPGTPSSRSIVASSAELRPILNEEVGGIGTWASNGGEAPANIRAERDVCAEDDRVDVADLVRFTIAIPPSNTVTK